MRQRARSLGVREERIIVLPQGVDTTKFAPGLPTDQVRRELGIPRGTPVVLFVGNLYPRKGVHYLLEASEAVLARHPEAIFVLAGTGPSEKALRERARRADPARFRFVGFRQDIPQLLNIAEVLVLPSLREGLPQVILEAYACGVPVIANDVGGVKDVLRDGENGHLLEPEQPDRISAAINHLLDDEALRAAMGKANRAIAVAEYDLQKIAKDTLREMKALSVRHSKMRANP
jgi:glycosyltransferase involved in cell wall biosynthesis